MYFAIVTKVAISTSSRPTSLPQYAVVAGQEWQYHPGQDE
jgi:hypothetical protein